MYGNNGACSLIWSNYTQETELHTRDQITHKRPNYTQETKLHTRDQLNIAVYSIRGVQGKGFKTLFHIELNAEEEYRNRYHRPHAH